MSIATELTALQGDITAARTAITTKGGTVTSGGGSSQLATDIATIPSGGGGFEINEFLSIASFENADFGHPNDTVILNIPNAIITNNFLAAGKGAKKLIVNAKQISSLGGFLGSYSQIIGDTLEEVNFNLDVSTVNVENAHYFVYNRRSLKKITGVEFGVSGTSGVTWYQDFYMNNSLEEIRFVPNVMKRVCNIYQCPKLSVASLISFANSLNVTTPTYNVSLTSAQISTIQGITGTVTDGMFVEDAQGATTLYSFIKDIKGRTITT